MFLAIFWIFFLAIVILGWWTWKNDSVPGYFIIGVLVMLVGGILFAEGLDIQTGTQLDYDDTNSLLEGTTNIYTTQTKENDGLVSFMAYFFPYLGFIIILWGIIVPFKVLEKLGLWD